MVAAPMPAGPVFPMLSVLSFHALAIAAHEAPLALRCLRLSDYRRLGRGEGLVGAARGTDEVRRHDAEVISGPWCQTAQVDGDPVARGVRPDRQLAARRAIASRPVLEVSRG